VIKTCVPRVTTPATTTIVFGGDEDTAQFASRALTANVRH
jgi:hypothetical protein